MTRLRPHTGWFLSTDDKKRLVDVFVVFVKVDKRTKRARKLSRESKQEKARDMICLYIKGRGPCFIDLKGVLRSLLLRSSSFEEQVDVVRSLFYLKATEIFNQGCLHDRYYTTHLNARYV